MRFQGLILDANLLVLLIVGLVSPALIPKHKRLSIYSEADFYLLSDFISKYKLLATTPNILTEAHNLALQIAEPARTEVSKKIALLSQNILSEEYIASRIATQRPEYLYLGLSDSVQMAANPAHHLLTDDLKLYQFALSIGKTAFNFIQLKEQEGFFQ